ncbi:MAG: succinate--CoA ligase [ADP-forming] subunit beta [Candidatus Binatia bacterium]|nr:MAG: succinate--CoA ligase [ADP-forming] subunit beta [Candidatus Binatia bacterium]
MNVHEFQAKEVLRRYGVAVPDGRVATSAEEVFDAASALGLPVVVKAQIHAGGRGKAGGVRLCSTAEEAREFAAGLLGKPLVTHQTGPEGRVVRRVLVERACEIEREYYLGLLVDRSTGRPTFMGSAEGGVEIEEVAARSPEKIVRQAVDPATGILDFQARRLAFAMGLPRAGAAQAVRLLKGVYAAFVERDASLAEINPLVWTRGGQLLALDAKMSFDDNALYRHPEVRELRDPAEEDPKEAEAAKHDLSYIALDGNIGCMVNGAGLAMATMDIIKLYGGSPANFLDVGGGASAEKVAAAFKILLSDSNVRAVLINIFGGIMKCDVIAKGVVEAARQVHVGVPIVVRLEGTNVEIGRQILDESELDIIAAEDMADAARKVVEAAKA